MDNLSGNISEPGDCNREKENDTSKSCKISGQEAAGCVYLQFSKDYRRDGRLSEKQKPGHLWDRLFR